MTEGVVRVGRTVRRPVRPHTAAVHGLLRHLEAAGFDGAPRVLGIDAGNREVLTYLPGVVARRPRPAFATADATLAALARLQLRYHEAVAGFEPPPGAWWDGEVTRFVDGPADIICHCDINLENVIFRPGPDGLRPYALIDFDLARPGTRLVDIIQTLRYWAPIADPADRDPALRDVDVPARITIFCEAYGLSCGERARLVPVASRWLRRSRATIAQRARMRGGAWTRMVDLGVGERLLRSAVWLERNQPEIEARLRRPIGPSQPVDLPSQPVDLPSQPVDLPSQPVDLPSQPAGLSRPAGPPPPARQPARQPVGPRQPASRPVPAGTAVAVSGALIGDLRRGHPVAAFSRGAAKLETRMYADEWFRGALYTSACVLAAALPAVAANRLTRHRPLLRGPRSRPSSGRSPAPVRSPRKPNGPQ